MCRHKNHVHLSVYRVKTVSASADELFIVVHSVSYTFASLKTIALMSEDVMYHYLELLVL